MVARRKPQKLEHDNGTGTEQRRICGGDAGSGLSGQSGGSIESTRRPRVAGEGKGASSGPVARPEASSRRRERARMQCYVYGE